MDVALNDWIFSLKDEELRSFVDTFYEVICASQAEDLIAFMADWKKSLNAVVQAMKGVDAETIGVMKQIFMSLFDIMKVHMKEELEARALKNPEELHKLFRESS